MTLQRYNDPDAELPESKLAVLKHQEGFIANCFRSGIIARAERKALKINADAAVELVQIGADVKLTQAHEAAKLAQQRCVDEHTIERNAHRNQGLMTAAHGLQEQRDAIRSSSLDPDIQAALMEGADSGFVRTSRVLTRDLPSDPPQTD